MQGSSLECNIPGIPYSMNERQRWLLANAMAHKKANKSAALQQLICCNANKHHGKLLR